MQRGQFKIIWLAALLFVGGGCGLWSGEEVAEPTAGPAAEVKPTVEGKPNVVKAVDVKDEQELKLARLWARVDDLEEQQSRSKERLTIVEKGVTLGLMPEELRRSEPAKKGSSRGPDAANERSKLTPKVRSKTASEKAFAGVPADAVGPPSEGAKANGNATDGKASHSEVAAESSPTGLSKADEGNYQKALASAHDLFRAGRYGRAVVEYSDIGKRYGDQVGGGMYLYWVAKSWVELKEYNTARQQLVEFLKDHGNSPWVPRAKFELGRVEWQLGMQDTALGRFRDIIQRHPYADAAEMAKMELQNLDKKL